MFEFELCHEGGGDDEDHDTVAFTLGDYGGPYEFMKCKPVAVVDEDVPLVIARFYTVAEASQWIGNHPDQDKVLRGGFGIDAPEGEEEKSMTRKISGMLHENVDIKEGENWEGQKVIELRFGYSDGVKSSSTSIVVIDRETAKDLSYLLLDALLYGENGEEENL